MSSEDGPAAQVTQRHLGELDRELRELGIVNLRLDARLAEQRVRLAPWWAATGGAGLLAAIVWAGTILARVSGS